MKLDEAAITENLRDAGCPEEFIRSFLQALADGSPAERERLLEQERCCILDRVHDEQKKLECFDYLRYQFKKKQDPS